MGKRRPEELQAHCGKGESAHEIRAEFSRDFRGPVFSGLLKGGGCECYQHRQDPPGDDDESRGVGDNAEKVFEAQRLCPRSFPLPAPDLRRPCRG